MPETGRMGGEDQKVCGQKTEKDENPNVLDSLAVDVSVNFSLPGAPLRAPVFLLALFSTENDPEQLQAANIMRCFWKVDIFDRVGISCWFYCWIFFDPN